jgi:hypothetical protein
MTLEIQRLKENTPRAVLDAARRIHDDEVMHDPRVARLRRQQVAVDLEQRAVAQQAEAARATLDALAQKRAAAEQAVRDAQAARTQAAAAALLGDPAAERAFHEKCFAAAKAQRILEMHDIGEPVLRADHERLMATIRGLGARSTTIANELADACLVARIEEAHRRAAARR